MGGGEDMAGDKIMVSIEGYGGYQATSGIKAIDLLNSLDLDTRYPVTAITINNHLSGLETPIIEDANIKLLDMTTESGSRVYRRTATFILIKASQKIFPNRRLIIKHALSNGLYCEFDNIDIADNSDYLELIDREMARIIQANQPINRLVMPREEATNIFKKQNLDDKVDLLSLRDKENVHLYEIDGFYEYFYGYLAPHTGIINNYRLIPYDTGLILQTPSITDPEFNQPYKKQPKLADIFREAKAWADMLETPHVAALAKKIDNGNLNEIIQINEALHEKKIAMIADEICADREKRLILISGPSSSGKTTFAQRLLIQLKVNGRNPVSVSLDNYFVDREQTPLDGEGNYNFEALEALKLDLFNEDLIRLLKGEEVETPIFNFRTGTTELEGNLCKVPEGEPIIIEGIHALNDKLTYSIPAKNKYRIYVSALTQLNVDYSNRIPTTDCRLLRRMIRDSRTRGYSAINTLNRWPSVRRGEEKNIFPFQENADVMFNTSLVYELAILKPMAEKLLNEIGDQCEEYAEAQRLLKFLSYFREAPAEGVPPNSILREFIGGSWFKH